MRWKQILAVAGLLVLLTGCTTKNPQEIYHPRLVIRIDVTATDNGETIRRTYHTQEKMQIILNYLRLLEPISVAKVEADSFRSDAYELRLLLSDGSVSIYRQIYDEYLQEDDGPWKRIDDVQGSMLQPLLKVMESDPE